MKIRAFHGLRYSGDAADAGTLAAPPYDQISAAERDRLHQTEHHFASLTCPVATGSADAHRQSANLHASWLDRGVIQRESTPSLYANRIELPSGASRAGLTALVDIEAADSGIIRPHEETVSKTVAERLGLLRTTRVDYEPILILAEDDGRLDRMVAEDCGAGPSLSTHTDLFGNRHDLVRIEDPTRIASYREVLAASYGLIADGHHRYKTAGLFAAETGSQRGEAAAAKLAVVTSLSSASLAIDPIHRALPFAPQAIDGASLIRERVAWQGTTGADLARAVAEAPPPTIGYLDADGRAELWHLDAGQGPADLPPAASQLGVVMLHRSLFPAWRLAPETATDGTIQYRSNPEDLFAAVRGGDFPAGIFLPPMTPEAFAAAIANGDVLPPKSTRFLPKVVSGQVWAAHRDPVA